VSLWDEALGWSAIQAWGVGYPLEKISCLVHLRIGMSREPDHRTLHTRHSFLNGRGGMLTSLDGATTTRLGVDSVERYGHVAHTLLRQRSDL
jgi:hypothetical protein